MSKPFERRSPAVSICRGNGGKSFYATTAPVDIWIRCFEEGIPQDEVILSYIGDKEGMRGFLAVVIDQEIDGFEDFSRFVRRAVNILYLLRFNQFPSYKFEAFHHSRMDEAFSGTTVE